MKGRKKSRLERFFSLNQHRKRLGASKLTPLKNAPNYDELSTSLIDGKSIRYTHGAEKSLEAHLSNLKEEFVGHSELSYYHATLIVLIRRDYKADEHFRLFQDLWNNEGDFLLEHLNTRWLVSAADTLADLSPAPSEKALALSVSLLINTIKAYETERYLQKAETLNDTDERQKILSEQRVDLFDGTSALAVGTDDTLRNMRWRMDEICSNNSISGNILAELFNRLQREETVYSRMKQRHTRQKTAWW